MCINIGIIRNEYSNRTGNYASFTEMSILTSYIYYVTRYIDMKPLKKYLKIILQSLFVLNVRDLIIIMTEFLKPIDQFLPHFQDCVKIDVYFLFIYIIFQHMVKNL